MSSAVADPPVVQYIKKGRIDRLKQMLDKGEIGVNVRLADGRTLIHVASAAGHGDVVKFLLLKGANKEARDASGNLPLQVASSDQVKKYLSNPNIAVAESLLEPARDYLSLNNLPKVLEICDTALQKFAALAEAQLLRGHALAGLGRVDEADLAYQEAIRHDRTKPDAFWARVQLAQGKVDVLLARIDELLEAFPRDQAARFNKAMALMQLQRIPESLPLWEDLIEDDPANAAAWGNKGLACFALGDMVRAFACLTRSQELSPGLQPFSRALEDLERTIYSRSTSLKLRAQEALAEAIHLQRSWRWEQSIDLFEEVLRISPNDERAWAGKGLSLARLRLEDDALVCFQRAVTLNPLSVVANTELRMIKRAQLLREREAAVSFAKNQSDRMAETRTRIESSKKAFGITELEGTRAEIEASRLRMKEERKQIETRFSSATRVKLVYRKVTKAFRLGPSLLEEMMERFHIDDVAVLVFKQEDVTCVDGFSVIPAETLLLVDNPNFYRKIYVTAQ